MAQLFRRKIAKTSALLTEDGQQTLAAVAAQDMAEVFYEVAQLEGALPVDG